MKHDEFHQDQLEKAAALIAKYPDIADLLGTHYGKKVLVSTYNGVIDFSLDGYTDIVGGNDLTYDEYLDIQIRSLGTYRRYLAMCYHYVAAGFRGQTEKINDNYLCFKHLFVEGMFFDGEMFDGKEDHVWMSNQGFESFCVGDCISFCADVYRYIKTGRGRSIDYGLCHPSAIHKIQPYRLPSDDELSMQAIQKIICETCFLSEHCNRVFCLRA